MSSWNRNILVVSAKDFEHLSIPLGFFEADEKLLAEVLAKSRFRIRTKELEEDENWLQLIPYDLVFDLYGKLFLYSRKDDHKEKRLASLRSFGIGGHVEEDDFEGMGSYTQGLLQSAGRELREEIRFEETKTRRFLGFLKRNKLPVEHVHLGLVFKVEISCFESIGPKLGEGDFYPISEICNFSGELEGWSQELLPHLEKIYRGVL